MKSCRTPGGYSKGGTGYPLEAPYASASGPVSENTGPDWAKTTPLKASIERNASIRRRIMARLQSKSIVSALRPYHQSRLMSGIGTFETCRRTVTMSVYKGRAEVVGTRPNRRE